MKKVRLLSLITAAAILLGCLAACNSKENSNNSGDNSDPGSNSTDSGKTYTLKIDYPNPENSAIYPVLLEWGKWVNEQSDGRIEVKVYAAGALGSIVDCVTNCSSGVTDGFWSAMNLYPGVFPLCDAFMLPMMGASKMEVMQDMIQDMTVKQEFQDQFEENGVHLVAMHSSNPSTFIFKDEVDSISAMQGKTVRTLSNFTTPWLEGLGAIPVSVSSNDGYENIEKGVVQGGLWYTDQIQSSALYEVIKTCFYGETAYPCLALFINADIYNNMPADLQKVIDDSREYYLSMLYDAYYGQEELVMGLLDDAGVKTYVTSEEDLEWLRNSEAVQSAWNGYIESIDKLGMDGEAMLKEIQDLIAHYNEIYS